MEDPMDCMIDLNSPVVTNLRTSLMPSTSMCPKSTPALCNYMVSSFEEENNPFDMVVRQTEMNEADKNDPFEIAFETACGYQAESADLPVVREHLKEFPEMPSGRTTDDTSVKSMQVFSESDTLKECIEKVSVCLDEVNLDDIQPPEFLVSSSCDSFDNESININDTLNLSAMSDLKLPLRQTECLSVMEEQSEGDDFLLGESAASLKRKPLVKSQSPKRVLSPIHFPSEPLTISEKCCSFEESPIKALCELQSEESVKTLIESRIQKCIAKALNESHEQFGHSILLDAAGETSSVHVSHEVKPPRVSLRALPQNLHLLQCTKPQQSYILSPIKQKLLEELTIPVLDQKSSAPRTSFSQSFDIITTKLENSPAETEDQHSFAMSDEKISQYREIIDAQLQQGEQEIARYSLEGSKPKGHRRSLSCDNVYLPPQLPLRTTKGSSPPKLPPLPLSSETIRDLNLCSKYSPPKTKSAGSLPAKLTNRPALMPPCAQPKLVLKKKLSTAKNGPVIATGSFGGGSKGPLKAVVPVRNMTRFTESPRPSAQSQNRRASIALSRKRSLDSPNFQKSKLCPLAASTPAVLDKAEALRVPSEITGPPRRPRVLSSGIPSPSRRGSIATSTTKPQTLNAKGETPTRKISVSANARNGNPRVLLERNNGLTSPTLVRKPGIQFAVHTQPSKCQSQTVGKENVACL